MGGLTPVPFPTREGVTRVKRWGQLSDALPHREGAYHAPLRTIVYSLLGTGLLHRHELRDARHLLAQEALNAIGEGHGGHRAAAARAV